MLLHRNPLCILLVERQRERQLIAAIIIYKRSVFTANNKGRSIEYGITRAHNNSEIRRECFTSKIADTKESEHRRARPFITPTHSSLHRPLRGMD